MPQTYYEVWISPEARADMNQLHYHIAFECFQRKTADKYLDGILSTIDKLEWLGGSIGVSTNKTLRQQYGSGVRTIIYKRMSIIYTVQGNIVIVRRIISGRNIK